MLEEEQVRTDPLTGRPKIAKEVFEEMRRFLTTETGEDLSIKIDKVKRTVKEAESSPISQKTILRLEAPPIITQELNKGKGPVFDYGNVDLDRTQWDLNVNTNKLMAASMRAHSFSVLSKKTPPAGTLAPSYDSEGSLYASQSDCPTVFRAGSSEPYLTGTGRKKARVRRRPPRAQRQTNQLALTPAKELASNLHREGKEEIGSRKRKKTDQGAEACSLNKLQCLPMIPNEGSPTP